MKLVEGDMSHVALRKRFPLVTCPFNALLHLYDRASLEAIWRQIAATPSCALCEHGRTGPRCSACVLRGMLP